MVVIEPMYEIGGRLVRGVGCGVMGGCGRRNGCGIRVDDGGNVIMGVMDAQELQGGTEKGQRNGVQNIAMVELSTSRERS